MPETKPFTLVVCPKCGNVRAIKKHEIAYLCHVCNFVVKDVDKEFKLGLHLNKETGEETWEGVKDE